jgi:glutathione S-transferase
MDAHDFGGRVTLVLYQHPFASYCQKALIALYELDLPFDSHLVEGAKGRAELARLWPLAGIPVLCDKDTDLTLPESTTIIEYLDSLPAGGPTLVPADACEALQARLWDRFGDHHLATPMQKIVGDELRPEGRSDPEGVAEARRTLDIAYGVLAARLADRPWAGGATFTVADCATFPALFYLRAIHRWDSEAHANITRYYRELLSRPSIARVVEEARPFRKLFPLPWPPDQDEPGPFQGGAQIA